MFFQQRTFFLIFIDLFLVMSDLNIYISHWMNNSEISNTYNDFDIVLQNTNHNVSNKIIFIGSSFDLNKQVPISDFTIFLR